MAKVFLSPYTSIYPTNAQSFGSPKSFEPLHAALRKGEWPYDYGDDPSFFCRYNLKGNLTWGVCRADVRSQVQPGDVVVFLSFTRMNEQVDYRLCAIATVERKIRQGDIFSDPSYVKYSHYLNLLVRPTDGAWRSWEHHEPGAPERDWHKDWLSRIVPFKFFSKGELDRQAQTHRVSLDSYLDGKQFRFGYNYVLFSDDPIQTLVLQYPPTVAHAAPPRSEVWCPDKLSSEIFKRTVEEAQPKGVKRTLRLDNKVLQPHSPPIRWELSEREIGAWRNGLFEFLLAQCLARC
jgi:hypothetical protein